MGEDDKDVEVDVNGPTDRVLMESRSRRFKNIFRHRASAAILGEWGSISFLVDVFEPS